MDYRNVAVIIPCFNESEAISQVVHGFKNALPEAPIYVYDNCSTDDTLEKARDAGAIVRFENRKGKGNVVRRMFSDVDADFYILVDGDLTYDPVVAPRMLERLIKDKLDMLNIARIGAKGSYRKGHRLGNFLLTKTVKIKRMESCLECQSSGASPGSQPSQCSACQGTGEIRQVQRSFLGQIVNVQSCHSCSGIGYIGGREQKTVTINIKIPAGVSNGNYMTLEGEGDKSVKGSRGEIEKVL